VFGLSQDQILSFAAAAQRLGLFFRKEIILIRISLLSQH